MSMNRKITIATALSVIGGVLSFLPATGELLSYPDFEWSLTSMSSFMTFIAATFLYFDHGNRKLWGLAILVYSNLGFAGFVVSHSLPVLTWGLGALILTAIGGALAISSK